ncbi:MAG: TonB-dependent receptor plug domain-containing protein [Verrucomicrobia bacterium]|nr:TonB-dependent receptor plug domain-containing protein [Verrucomicrobiota bacterium]
MHRKPTHPLLSRRLVAPLCALLCLTSARAQPAAPASASPALDAKALAKYDKNKNGRLDADEAAAMRADEAKAAGSVATSAASASSDEVVSLSPFEVNAGNDKGYSASSSLAGTRLNSKLEDIAGSVSVITKQQLLDTAALDINDIFQYEVGTEGTGQYTDLTSDGRGDYDNVAGNPTGANRMRGLAQANITAGGFAASSSIPIDVYNIDAVEIVRGPNSNLAGLSDAGGSVNLVNSRANVNREITSFSARVDSYGGFRTSMDLNRPLIRNKLSGRFSAVYEEKGFIRKPSEVRTNRQQFALTYKPFRTTTLTGSFEHYQEYANRANSIMPKEYISFWRANGSPTYDPLTQMITVTRNGVATKTGPITTTTNNIPAGLGLFGSSNVRNLMGIDGGQIQWFMRGGNPSNNAGTPFQLTQATQPADVRPLWKLAGTTDKSIYDWTDLNLAAPNYETNRANIVNVRLEQSLISTQRHHLDFEAAWRREDQMNYRRMFIAQQDGVGNTITVDTNESLLDGKKNPFFMRPYIGGLAPQVYKRPNFTDQYRAQLAYQLDLRREPSLLKWLGYHRALGYAEYRMSITAPSGLRYHDSVVSGSDFVPSRATAINNSNGLLVYPIFYLGGSNSAVQYANPGPVSWAGPFNGSFPTAASGVGTANWKATTGTLDEVYFSQGLQKKKVRSGGLSLQSFFVNDQIIPTIGRRRDRVYTVDSYGTTIVDGLADETNLRNFGPNKKWRFGDTETKGVVVKPFRGLSFVRRAAEDGTGVTRFLGQFVQGFQVHYNQSDSFQPADTAYNVFLEQLPNPQGKTKEYGFSLNLFDNRLYLRATHFETTQFHARTGIGTVATRAMAMDFDVPGQNLTFDLYTTATGWQQTLHPEYTVEQAQEAAAKQIGYTTSYIASASGKAISDALDATSKGTEIELQFNPTRYWTLKFTGGQQVAIDDHVSLFIQELIDQRMPYWTTVEDPTAPIDPATGKRPLWWTTRLGSTGIPRDYYIGNIEAPLNLAITTQGKRKPQTREYTAKVITNYQLAGIAGDHKWLRGVSVGGNYRWASKGAIGYYAAPADADGVIRRLDRDRPIYDKPVGNLDLLLSYNTRLFRDKVRANFQLNVTNVTESGHLQGVAVNPDGKFWNYRIVDPRQFIFTTRFDL